MTSIGKHLLGVSAVLGLLGTAVACDGGTTGDSASTGGTSTGSIPNATGGAAAGTGGAAAGTGGAAAGTGGTSGGSHPDSTFATDGYGLNDPWMGYLFTVVDKVDGTITPECDDAGTKPCFTASGAQLCATGTLAADPDYQSFALIGWNINQPMPAEGETAAPDPATWTVTGTGVKIGYVNNGSPTSKFRVQIQGLSETDQWCATLPAGGGTVNWTDFRSKCWDPTLGEAFNPATTPIAQVQVQIVQSSTTAAEAFDFCVTDMALVP